MKTYLKSTHRCSNIGGVAINDKQIIEAIKRITERGSNAEVKQKKDGTYAVYEVKKNIVTA